MSLAIRMVPEAVRSLGFASIGAAYMGVGTSLDYPARIIVIQNLTDKEVMFSFDGIDDHIPLPTRGHLVLDISANKTLSTGFFMAEGQRLYVKHAGSAPASGNVYFSAFHGVD